LKQKDSVTKLIQGHKVNDNLLGQSSQFLVDILEVIHRSRLTACEVLCLHVRQVPGLNLGLHWLPSKVSWFSQSITAVRPKPLPFASFQKHHFSLILAFVTTEPEMLIALLNTP
jgi:hypothetical protein